MLKKLAVPFLTLALATFGFGCSSSTSNNGTGGSGGAGGKGGGAGTTAAGGKGGGAAGSSAAGTNGGGGKGGGGGSAVAGTNGGGGAAGGAAGGGGGAAGGGGGAAGSNGGAAGGADAGNPDGSARAECTVTTSGGNDALPASVFCAQLEVNCPGQFGTFTSKADCEAKYTASGQEHCRSYHLCWGVEGITMDGGIGNPTFHCPHTIGLNGVCTAIGDGAAGN